MADIKENHKYHEYLIKWFPTPKGTQMTANNPTHRRQCEMDIKELSEKLPVLLRTLDVGSPHYP